MRHMGHPPTTNSVIYKRPYKGIISIILLWSFLLNIVLVDFAYADLGTIPFSLQENKEQAPASTPQGLMEAQNNAEAMIQQKNDFLNIQPASKEVSSETPQKPEEAPILLPGDFDGNGVINVDDFNLWRQANGSHPEDPNFNPSLDLNQDGAIDLTDYLVMAQSYYEQEGYQGQAVGDLNNDGQFNMWDVITWRDHQNSHRGEPQYQPTIDLNFDNVIDELDRNILTNVLRLEGYVYGDLNGDMVIDRNDYELWRQARDSGLFNPNYDLNPDGVIDTGDLLVILKARYEQEGFSNTRVADFNNDGVIDFNDVQSIINAFLKRNDHPDFNRLADLNMNGMIELQDIQTLVDIYAYLGIENGTQPHPSSISHKGMTLVFDSGKTVGEVRNSSNVLFGYFTKLVFSSQHGNLRSAIIIYDMEIGDIIFTFVDTSNNLHEYGAFTMRDWDILGNDPLASDPIIGASVPIIIEALARWTSAASGADGLAEIRDMNFPNPDFGPGLSMEFLNTIVDLILKKIESNPSYSFLSGPNALTRGDLFNIFYKMIFSASIISAFSQSNYDQVAGFYGNLLNRIKVLYPRVSQVSQYDFARSLFLGIFRMTYLSIPVAISDIEQAVSYLLTAYTANGSEKDIMINSAFSTINYNDYYISSDTRWMFITSIMNSGLVTNLSFSAYVYYVVSEGFEIIRDHFYKLSASLTSSLLSWLDSVFNYYSTWLLQTASMYDAQNITDVLRDILNYGVNIGLTLRNGLSNIIVSRFNTFAQDQRTKVAVLKLAVSLLQKDDLDPGNLTNLLGLLAVNIPSLSRDYVYSILSLSKMQHSNSNILDPLFNLVIQYLNTHIAEMVGDEGLAAGLLTAAIDFATNPDQYNLFDSIIMLLNRQHADETTEDYLSRVNILKSIIKDYGIVILDVLNITTIPLLQKVKEILALTTTAFRSSVKVISYARNRSSGQANGYFVAVAVTDLGVLIHEMGHTMHNNNLFPDFNIFRRLFNISGPKPHSYDPNSNYISNYNPNEREDFAEAIRYWNGFGWPYNSSVGELNRAIANAQSGNTILLEKYLYVMKFFISEVSGRKWLSTYRASFNIQTNIYDYIRELMPINLDALNRITSVDIGYERILFTYDSKNRLLSVQKIVLPVLHDYSISLFGATGDNSNVKIYDNGRVKITMPDGRIIEGYVGDFMQADAIAYWKIFTRSDGSLERFEIYQQQGENKVLLAKRFYDTQNRIIADMSSTGGQIRVGIKDYASHSKTIFTVPFNPNYSLKDLTLENVGNYSQQEKMVYLYDANQNFEDVPLFAMTDPQLFADHPVITLYYQTNDNSKINSWQWRDKPGIFIVVGNADIVSLINDPNSRNTDNINNLIHSGDDIFLDGGQMVALPQRSLGIDYDPSTSFLNFVDLATHEVVVSVKFPEESTVTIDNKKYGIKVTDGVLKLEAVFRPFSISVSTSTDSNKNLTITVDEGLKATIVWYGQTYTGVFDVDHGTIVVDQSSATYKNQWIFTLKETPEGYSLESFDMIYDSSYGKSVNHYMFSGNILTNISGRYNSANFTSEYHTDYFYDTNGRLVRTDSSYSYQSTYSGSSSIGGGHSRTYYGYDPNGDRTMVVSVGSNVYNDVTSFNASYSLVDRENHTITNASVQNADPALLELIKSADGYGIIDNYTGIKKTTYYEDSSLSWNKRKFSIEYAKDGQGQFIAKKVTEYVKDAQGRFLLPRTYIVVGEPDAKSGEKNDIFIKNWQTTKDGYMVKYGQAQPYDYKTQRPSYLNYGLVFTKWVKSADGQWKQVTVVVDYPKENKVKLDGKEYAINIDETGTVNLTEIIILTKISPYNYLLLRKMPLKQMQVERVQQ